MYAVVADNENNRTVMVKGKNNNAPRDQRALAYTFATKEVATDPETGAPIIAPYIVWGPEHVDDLATTVVPRLKAAGADLARVHVVQMVAARGKDGERMFSLVDDLDLLRQKIAAVGDVRMVLVDPISAYLGVGKVDSFRTTDVRAVLAPVMDLARELEVAFIGILHFNKKTDVTNALLRISDSLAFGAAARLRARG